MYHEIQYYHAGYYLIRLRPIDFRDEISKRVFTASECVNDGLLDSCFYSWTTNNNARIGEIKDELQLDDEKIQFIRTWVDRAFDDNRIGWPNVFYELETVKEYSQLFLSHLMDKQIISVYFPEQEVSDLLQKFTPKKENLGSVGLYNRLREKVLENSLSGETFIGFDIIGIEDGGDFHTFYCHDMSNDLVERFRLRLNPYGLFEDMPDWKSVSDYMNAEETGCEPVPWYICKTKLVDEGGLLK